MGNGRGKGWGDSAEFFGIQLRVCGSFFCSGIPQNSVEQRLTGPVAWAFRKVNGRGKGEVAWLNSLKLSNDFSGLNPGAAGTRRDIMRFACVYG